MIKSIRNYISFDGKEKLIIELWDNDITQAVDYITENFEYEFYLEDDRPTIGGHIFYFVKKKTKKCECGAKSTNNPNCHANWCPAFRN